MTNAPGSDVAALMQFEANKKSVGVAFLLWAFTGSLGGHRFYSGRAGTGAVMAITFVIGLLAIAAGGGVVLVVVGLWAIIDAFRIPGWIREHNTKLAATLTPRRSATNRPQSPPNLPPDQGEDWNVQQLDELLVRRTVPPPIPDTATLPQRAKAQASRR